MQVYLRRLGPVVAFGTSALAPFSILAILLISSALLTHHPFAHPLLPTISIKPNRAAHWHSITPTPKRYAVIAQQSKTHPAPLIIFLASAISFFISGSASTLAIILGNTNIITPDASIMSTIGLLSMASMLTPVLEV